MLAQRGDPMDARRQCLWIFASALLLLSGVAGCGKAPTVLTGVVTFDGDPVADAAIEFFPKNGDAPTAGAFSDARGRYRVQLSPTTYTVCVAASRKVGERQEQDPGMPQITKVDVREQYLPSQYTLKDTTPLTATALAEKTTTFDIAIIKK